MKWDKNRAAAFALVCCMLFTACLPAIAQALKELTDSEFREIMGMAPKSPPAASPAASEEGPPLVVVATARPTEEPVLEQNEFNLLLIGTDTYTDKQQGRSDTMILVRMDAAGNVIRMVSFMRDLYVKIPGHGSTRLNAAYSYGGAELLEETLWNNFNVTADAYVAVNFEIMADLVDQIGGVDIEVSSSEMRQLNSILKYYNKKSGHAQSDQLLTQSGVQTLTGRQALSYSRIRKIDSDFQRTSRQREVVEAAFHKITQMDMGAITSLILTNMSRVTTDIDLQAALRLIPMALKARDAEFQTFRIPADNAYTSENIRGMDVLVPNLEKNKRLLNAFLNGE